jgi:hypothetical protein
MCAKVCCSIDKQWKLWVKVGVQKLVSLDGVTTSMTEQESCIFRKDNSSVCHKSFNSGMAWHHQSVSVQMAALENRVLLPMHGGWEDMEHDRESCRRGNELLDVMGWDNQVATNNTQVSHWWMQQAVCGKHQVVN